jgi:Xaa-Pro aminopeptidase
VTEPAASPTSADLTDALRSRVLSALSAADFDWLLLCLPENIAYVSGYRSVVQSVKREPTMAAALNSEGVLFLAGPSADAGAVLYDRVVPPDRYIPYGRFFFESTAAEPALRTAAAHASFEAAAAELLERLDNGIVGIDGTAAAALSTVLGTRPVVDASGWMLDRRARKTPGEVELLERAARLTEDAIDGCLELIRPGATEVDLARRIAAHISEGGGIPKFVVVTSGERSALADVAATGRVIESGDLVRFDIGCLFDGYWSDLGRTVVVGLPDDLQRRRYDALLAGEQAQLDAARPGITAAELFDLAVATVEAHGLAPYRRHHCGHAIGSEVYERPVIAPGSDEQLQEGMTFCFETPFYELGWGGMIVEDTVVITSAGCRVLTVSERELRAL